MAPPIIMVPLSASGIEDVIEYRSAPGQTSATSQRVNGIKGLFGEVRGSDEDTSLLAGYPSMGSRCIATDA